MVSRDSLQSRDSHSSLPAPTGSVQVRSSAGDGDRYANKLPTASEPKPHVLAKPMQRLIVGSSFLASAADGFNMTKST
jgi:hypothetical protein